MKFNFFKTTIPGVLLIEPRAFEDSRGFFMEYYNKEEFAEGGFLELFVQDNHSCSKKGVVRGMHYQLNPSPMGKLVKVVKGSIFDVGVDLREGSPSFGKWHGDTLSAENKKMLYFPPGIAHGFLSLENDTHVIYKCTGVYSSENERALMWNDPDVNIKWPTNLVSEIILSDRDKAHPSFKTAEKNFKF